MKDKFLEKKLLYKVVVQKDPDAYAQLYDLYVEKIYRFVYYKVSSKTEAEDITSEVFLKAWNYLIDRKDDSVASFSGLIYKITRNCIIDLYRKKARKVEAPLSEGEAITIDMAESVHIRYEADQVLALVGKLKSDYQEVILLRYVDELEVKEIAEILGKSSTSVRVMIHRSLKKLEQLAAPGNDA